MSKATVFDADLAQTKKVWEEVLSKNAKWLEGQAVAPQHINRCVALMTCGEKQKFASLIKCKDRPMTRMWHTLNRPCGKPRQGDTDVASMLELWWSWFTQVNGIKRSTEENFARFRAHLRAGGTHVWNVGSPGNVLSSNPFPADTQWGQIWTASPTLVASLSVAAHLGPAPDYTYSKYVSIPFVDINTPDLKSVIITRRQGEVPSTPKWWGMEKAGQFGLRRARAMHKAVRTLSKWLPLPPPPCANS